MNRKHRYMILTLTKFLIGPIEHREPVRVVL